MTKEQDVNVVLIDFPSPGNEMVVPNEDGTYTILINAKISKENQLKAYRHAMNHIINNDFDKDNVQKIEYHAHNFKIPEGTELIPAKRFEQRLKILQRERKRLKQELEKREREIDLIMEVYGSDCFFGAAEDKWLYGGIE